MKLLCLRVCTANKEMRETDHAFTAGFHFSDMVPVGTCSRNARGERMVKIASGISSSSDPYFDAAWAIITAAGCVDHRHREIDAQRLALIIDELCRDRRQDDSEIAWLAADRFVTDQRQACR